MLCYLPHQFRFSGIKYTSPVLEYVKYKFFHEKNLLSKLRFIFYKNSSFNKFFFWNFINLRLPYQKKTITQLSMNLIEIITLYLACFLSIWFSQLLILQFIFINNRFRDLFSIKPVKNECEKNNILKYLFVKKNNFTLSQKNTIYSKKKELLDDNLKNKLRFSRIPRTINNRKKVIFFRQRKKTVIPDLDFLFKRNKSF